MTAAVDPVEGIAFEANPEQRRVIDAGPHDWLLVVAGPGTGKTQVAAMRLVHLLRSGLQPAQILVLSFSRSAVATLTRRIASLRLADDGIVEDLRHLAIRTFDSGGVHDEENNYLFGAGGAGCFSDGKLTCRMSGADFDWVLRSFVTCGGRKSLVYEHRPHLGSNKLPLICRNYRREIERLGGEYKFRCRMEGLDVVDGQIRGLQTSSGYIATRHVLLGMGHSARDAYSMLLEAGIPLKQKAFQLGLRIEQPQEQVNQWK